jgi:hypothetical protein
MTIDLEELRQKKAAEALEAERKETQPEGRPVTTAFLVVQDTNGQWTALHDWSSFELAPERAATIDDIIGGSAAIQTGAQAQITAFQTVSMMQQQAHAMQQAYQNQQIAQQLNLKGK